MKVEVLRDRLRERERERHGFPELDLVDVAPGLEPGRRQAPRDLVRG